MAGEQTLTPKQQRFVDAYLISLNATEAYSQAGYRGKGAVARAAAARLLTNVNIQTAIRDAQERYPTWADAQEGHAAMVARVQAVLTDNSS